MGIYKTSIICLLITLILVISGCINNNDHNDSNKLNNEVIISYNLEIEFETKGKSNIILPIPTRGINIIDYKDPSLDWLSKLIYNNSEISIYGKVKYEIIRIEKNVSIPFALNIEIENYSKIVSKQEYYTLNQYQKDSSLYDFEELTLASKENNSYLIYYNGTSNNLKINYSCYIDWNDKYFNFDEGRKKWFLHNYDLKNGWQYVNFEYN